MSDSPATHDRSSSADDGWAGESSSAPAGESSSAPAGESSSARTDGARSSSIRDDTATSTRDAGPPRTNAGARRNEGGDRGRLERTVPHLAEPIRKTGFWAAIVLPFLYVPLLAIGLNSWVESTTFLAVVLLNLTALYVGHAHRR